MKISKNILKKPQTGNFAKTFLFISLVFSLNSHQSSWGQENWKKDKKIFFVTKKSVNNKTNSSKEINSKTMTSTNPSEFQGTKEYKLANGLKVLIREDHSAPIFTQVIFFNVGSKNDPQGISGIAHYLEHMQFNGTKTRPKGAISEGIESKGGSFNAATSSDYTMYYMTLPASESNLEFSLALEADRMRNSIINETEAAREKKVVISELMGGENNPRTLLSREIYKNLFPEHPYGIPIIGWREEVENIKVPDLESFYNTYYQPNNATLIVVGDLNAEGALAKIKTYFEAIPSSGKEVKTPKSFKHYSVQNKNIEVKSPTQTSMLSLNWPAVSFKDPDYPALSVLASILSNGDLSRLEKLLVDSGEVSYIEASMRKGKDPFNFSIFAAAAKDKDLSKIQEIILKEVANVQANGVKADELEAVKAKTETSYLFGLEEPDSMATQLGFFEIVAGDWKQTFDWSGKIQAVTKEQVQKVAQKYLAEDKLLVGKLLDDPNYKGPKFGGSLQQSEVANFKSSTNVKSSLANNKSSKGIQAEKIVLDNGLTLVLRQNTNLPILALAGTIDAGGIYDRKLAKDGVSSLTAMMCNRGSKDYTRDQLNQEIDRIGAELSLNPDNDFISVSAKGRAKDADLIIKLIAQQLRFPSFSQEEFSKLKAQVLAELKQSKDDMRVLGKIAAMSSIYNPEHPSYEIPLEEQIKAVEALELSDLKAFHQAYYLPQRTILSVSGDFNKETLLKSLNAYFADWKSANKGELYPDMKQAVSEAKTKEIALPGKSQSMVILGHAGEINRSHPDYYALLIANDILGGGSSLASRLGKRVREEAGLVYSIYSSFNSGRSAGAFMIQMGVPPEKAAEAIKLTKEEVTNFITNEISDEELERAKNYRSGFFVSHNLTSNESVASSLNQYSLWNMDLETINSYPTIIQTITKEDVKRVAKKYIHPDKLNLVIVKPE